MRDGQDDILDRIDTYEAALLGLTKMVSDNRARIEVLDGKMDRLMAHLKVPPKLPAGFVKE